MVAVRYSSVWFSLLELAILLVALGILGLIAYTCRTLQTDYLAALEKDAALQKYRDRLVFAFGDRALTLDDTAFVQEVTRVAEVYRLGAHIENVTFIQPKAEGIQ